MRLNVKLYGITKEIVGQTELKYCLSSSSDVSSLRKELKREYPELGRLTSLLVAVNGEYAPRDLVLNEQDEVVLIPPVSGG
ncbi:molybdopterin synthase sulfur carrier subunit [Fodinibius roseus]|uniref:Molybdopterin synthase sulfur carrier subunit n=1 Tax=Fodinibius roseus TaxID=1194090 RepID=A0A1M5H5X2_9BACT|nr:MoaD/ThiS family protein [Fodinibius roseus]SHG11286.1 molybdopterin synthase sulfur carrier subunit [Fodinibius roseus]